jgi:2',3'-cyclic-nucleotide 2'-phosphodiesterase/3'-nucleotidase
MKVKNIFQFLFLFLAFFIPSAQTENLDTTTSINIIYTSDIHAKLFDYNYMTGKKDNRGGMVNLAAIIKKIRNECKYSILIDNGDTIQGKPVTDDLYNTLLVKQKHPLIAAMNYLDYDAMVLGNHEFNFGLKLIDKIKKEANFPLLSANVKFKKNGADFAKPWIIIERGGIKIGIIGLTTPNIPRWDGPKVKALEFLPLDTQAEKYYNIIKNKVDAILVVAHASLEGRHENSGSIAKNIAYKIPQIAALLVGHDHQTFNTKINKIPVLAPSAYAEQLVQLELNFKKSKNSSWQLTGSNAIFYSAADFEPDPEFVNKFKYAHEKTEAFMKAPLAKVEEYFVPEYEIKNEKIPLARLQDTALIDLINKAQLYFVPEAQISTAALFYNNANIVPGFLTYRDLFRVYPYPNTLYGVEMTGKEIKSFLEWSAGYFNTCKPGDITISFNPKMRGYNYDMFQGISYKIDISKSPGNRIKALKHNNKPIDDKDKFKVAINNYRYSGLKESGIIHSEPYFKSDPTTIRSYLQKYVKKFAILPAQTNNNWELTGFSLKHRARKKAIKLINMNIIEIPDVKGSWNGKSINLEAKTNLIQVAELLLNIFDIRIYLPGCALSGLNLKLPLKYGQFIELATPLAKLVKYRSFY